MDQPTVNAVILTKTTDDTIFQMTKTCVETLLENGNEYATIKINIIETAIDKPEILSYPSTWNTITPGIPFNFNKFLNIGITAQKADYYLLCNNDLRFHPGYLNGLLYAFNNLDIGSASPISPDLRSQEILRKNESVQWKIGYGVGREISGWCLLISEQALQKIGLLDELFDFYFADNDYALGLRRNNIKHALVFDAKVTHLEDKKQTKEIKQSPNRPPPHLIPKHILNHKRLSWIYESERMLDGFVKLESKWGDYRLLKFKQLLHDFLFVKLGLKIPSSLLFSHFPKK